MKIAIVIDSMQGGGAERVTATLANAWIDRGHEVSIITLASGEDAYSLRPGVDRVCLARAQASLGAWSALRNNLGRLGALRRAIRQARPQVVLAMMVTSGVLTRLATLGLGVPVVVSERSYPPSLPLGTPWRLLRRLVYPRAGAVVSLTSKGGDWIAENCPGSRSVVIANPIAWPLPSGQPRIDPRRVLRPDRRVMLAVGRLGPEKGFDLLLDVFARLASEFSTWDLAVIGEGTLGPSLLDQAKRRGIADRVFFPGRVGNVQDWYERADLFALSSRFEGFPNVLVEAMASGCPVVSFDCDTGPRDIVRHEVDGLLVAPAAGAQGLGDALSLLMADEARRNAMGELATGVRGRFALDAIVAQWETLFAELCERRSPV